MVITQKLTSGAKHLSSIAIHPGGDNVITGTYDKKVQWFDLDLSTLPYQVLRYHQGGVRDVQYHRRYPLFASCGDDNNVTVSHGRTGTAHHRHVMFHVSCFRDGLQRSPAEPADCSRQEADWPH